MFPSFSIGWESLLCHLFDHLLQVAHFSFAEFVDVLFILYLGVAVSSCIGA